MSSQNDTCQYYHHITKNKTNKKGDKKISVQGTNNYLIDRASCAWSTTHLTKYPCTQDLANKSNTRGRAGDVAQGIEKRDAGKEKRLLNKAETALQ